MSFQFSLTIWFYFIFTTQSFSLNIAFITSNKLAQSYGSSCSLSFCQGITALCCLINIVFYICYYNMLLYYNILYDIYYIIYRNTVYCFIIIYIIIYFIILYITIYYNNMYASVFLIHIFCFSSF